MKKENILNIAPDQKDMRLDRLLRTLYPHIPYTAWAKMMRKGSVRLNGSRVKGAETLNSGDEVRIPPQQVLDQFKEYERPELAKKIYSEKDMAYFESLILKKTRDILFLNKPTGLATQGGTKIKISVDDLAKAYAEKQSQQLKLVHRLDKDTSGLLLLARNELSARMLSKRFKERTLQKYYIAIVDGVPETFRGTITAPLEKSGIKSKEMMRVSESGKKSETDYVMIEKLGKILSVLLVQPKTGRTHQIRAHLSYLGNPILGDHKYGTGNQHGSEELCLHAVTMNIPRIQGVPLCPFPAHMKRLFSELGIQESQILQKVKTEMNAS